MNSRPLRFALLPAAVLFAAELLSAVAQVPLRFDMGDAASPVPLGFALVDRTETYDPIRKWGWASGAQPDGETPTVGSIDSLILHTVDADLIRDGVTGSSPFSFRFDLPPGKYDCVLYVGDLNAAVLDADVDLRIDTGGALAIATDAVAQTLTQKATWNQPLGGFRRFAFVADIGAGPGDVPVYLDFGAGTPVMCLEVYAHEDAPLWFNHAKTPAPGLQRTAGYRASITNATAFYINNAQYAQALANLDAIHASGSLSTDDRIALGWAYSWLVGWLSGPANLVAFDPLAPPDDPHLYRDVRDDVLDKIDGLIATVKAARPDSALVNLLEDEYRDFRLGELVSRTRAYSAPAVFDGVNQSLGYLVGNLSAGAQLLQQMEGDIFETAPKDHYTESPFFPKALYLRGRYLYGRNTRLLIDDSKTPAADDYLEFTNDALAIFARLWPRLDPTGPDYLFPAASDATTLTWFIQTYFNANSGQLDNYLSAGHETDLNPGLDYSQVLWHTETQFADDPAAPEWADAQRRFARTQRRVGEWWTLQRLENGSELGGGAGDDVEAAGSLSRQLVARIESADSLFEQGMTAVLEGTLFGSEVDVAEGYYGPQTGAPTLDSEHSAEYTTIPLFILLGMRPLSPRYLEFAMRNVENMVDASTPLVAWSGHPTWDPGVRLFQAFHLGANAIGINGSGGPPMDVAVNLKALLPAFTLLDHTLAASGNLLLDTWAEYGRGWGNAAMSTALGKPPGIFPGAIAFADHTYTEVFPNGTSIDYPLVGGDLGNGTDWSWVPRASSSQLGTNHLDLYYLLLAVARSCGATAACAVPLEYLQPLHEAIEFVYADPGTSLVSPTLKLGVANAGFIAQADLTAAGGPGTPQSHIDSLIDQFGPPYVRYLAGYADKDDIRDLFLTSALQLQYLWPMTTTTVSYTDKLKQGGAPAIQSVQSTQSGAASGVTAPTGVVRWSNPDPDTQGELDVALLVDEIHGEAVLGDCALKVLAFNYASSGPVDVRCHVLRTIPAGDYRIRIGADVSPQDDQIDDPQSATEITASIDGRGDSVDLTVPPGMQVIDFVLDSTPGSLTPPDSFDLAIDPEDVSYDELTGKLGVLVHNVGSQDYDLQSSGGWVLFRRAVSQELIDFVYFQSVPHSGDFLETPVTDLVPRSILVEVDYAFTAGDPDLDLEVVVRKGGGAPAEVTTLNNLARALISNPN